MRAKLIVLSLLVVALPGASTATMSSATYSVLAERGVSAAAVIDAVARAGGEVTAGNETIGLYTATSARDDFAEHVARSAVVLDAARVRPIGQVTANPVPGRSEPPPPVPLDPLDGDLWGMRMIKAFKAHRVTMGRPKTLVGVLDSGIDATNPDLTARVNLKLSRNFVTDIPSLDGACEFPSCVDPVNWDDNGHGTHVAGTIAAGANGVGVTGVAPRVKLVNLRVGQDTGYTFLQPVVDALTFAGKKRLDVVNMSFYVDPWLYLCPANPADSPEAQAEQRVIMTALNRALEYADRRGVTLIGSLGNNHEDLGKPRADVTSPDYPPGSEYTRQIDNATCRTLPAEGPGVLGVSAIGPTRKKSDYSNYGVEQISVSAPGGWFRDRFGTPSYQTYPNLVLSTYPLRVLQAQGDVDGAGNITVQGAPRTLKSCKNGRCGYYTYLQGTSMAAPHAAGVAALVISRFGSGKGRAFGLPPKRVKKILQRSATDHACPSPPLMSYAAEGRPAEYDALCEGGTGFNGFYGHGIVNAFKAVTWGR